jgi:hypothetical protein
MRKRPFDRTFLISREIVIGYFGGLSSPLSHCGASPVFIGSPGTSLVEI